jgi:hypothetical protein
MMRITQQRLLESEQGRRYSRAPKSSDPAARPYARYGPPPEIETGQSDDQFAASTRTRELLRRRRIGAHTAAYNDDTAGNRDDIERRGAARAPARRVRWSRAAVVVARTARSDWKMRPAGEGDGRESLVTGRVVSTRPPTAAPVPLRPAVCSLSSVTAPAPASSRSTPPSTTAAAISARSRRRRRAIISNS